MSRTARARPGFSFVELLIVVALVGLLANLATVLSFDALRQAQVARVTTDVQVIGGATQRYALDNNRLPLTARWRRIPRGLASYLPPGFVFEYGEVEYRFHASFRRQSGILLRVPGAQASVLDDVAVEYVGRAVRLGRRRMFVPIG